MHSFRAVFPAFFAFVFALAAAGTASGQEAAKRFTPYSGQPGKDVVWVPTPEAAVEKMLDIAAVTPQDYVIDLGSGDGRIVIAAAKRGVVAHGVEYNEKMVELSRELAAEAGVAGRATFSQGDMYAADISKASALVLFLLTENLDRLVPKFLALTPGSRVVANTFRITGWEADRTELVPDCTQWCTVYLHIVPARVEGTWDMGDGRLTLRQTFQRLTGTLSVGGKDVPIADASLRGDRIGFTAGGVRYVGRVEGDRMAGAAAGGTNNSWSATKVGAN